MFYRRVVFPTKKLNMDRYKLLPNELTELFDRFQQGDSDAFKILYDLHFPRLFLIIETYVGQRELAEDIMSNAFIKLYERRAGIRELEHVYGFLFVVARNEAIEHYRNQRRQRVARKEQEQLVDREYHDPRETERERDRWMAKIQNLVELLPPARRKIFRLHFFDGLTIREIANQLKLTETTVRNQRNRALIFLRQAFLL
jgi:RNA polymerase sigma-70 factor (family 1)